MSRIALVTGASKGIGAAVSRRLIGEGWKVVGLARNPKDLQVMADDLDGFWPEPCDVRHELEVQAVFERIDARWGGLDALVNSAGVGGEASLLDGPVSDWRAMWETNVLGLALCSQLAVPRMEGRPGARIVHVSSMSGHRVSGPGVGMYAATKFAVRAMAEGLRLELRDRGSAIGVATVSPGTVNTRFDLRDDEPDRQRPYPLLQPADVAESVMHILGAPAHVDIGDVQLRANGQAI